MGKEFREFIARGSVFDLAVGIVIGAAFAAIVDSFVKDILMPPIGLVTGGVDFSNLFINLSGQEYASLAAAREAGALQISRAACSRRGAGWRCCGSGDGDALAVCAAVERALVQLALLAGGGYPARFDAHKGIRDLPSLRPPARVR